MASIVEKYEQILAADPRSRIFVELAKVLVDRGECARAVEVCRRGLEHHPSSILGRVTWGRALLESGDPKGAMDQFEIAIALEPASPYAFNHVGEALIAKGLHREALPVLARASELQPADARVRAWLDDAKRRVKGEPAPAAAAPPRARIALEDEGGEESTEPYRPIAPRVRTRETASPSIPAASSTATVAPTPPDDSAVHPERSADAEASARRRAPTPSSTPPPSVPPPLPSAQAARAGSAGPRSVLYMIPGESTRDVIPSLASRLDIPAIRDPKPAPARAADPAEADSAAARYADELREKLLAVPEPPASFVHRHRRLVLGGALAVALGAAGGVFLFVSARNAAIQAAGAAAYGRAGLARDTLASLREAHELLSKARGRSTDPEVVSLAAQVAAVLAAEHGDEKAREQALALVASGEAGEGAAVASWLLARTPAERETAETAILSARPSSGALVQALAGRILAGRGELHGARGRLEIAARANPPLLRALSDLGDLAFAAGDPEGALAYYGAAVAAHRTHPRSVVGAAEARLAFDHDLDISRKELDDLEADPGSAPPLELRPRFEIARARVQAALGEPGPAAARLARAAETLGETARLAATTAELNLQARAWDKAEIAAARAVAREPRDPDHHVLLARARIGRGRFSEALAATHGVEGRAVRIQRAIARYRLGQWKEARAELEKTGRDGKIPAEAAVWFALVDVADGRAARAVPLLERLTASKTPPPHAHVALGQALEAVGRRADAESAFRTATAREPLAPEGHVALGRILLATGRPGDALAPFERAVKLDPSDLAARCGLGEARLEAGQPSAARADLDFVLLAAPKDAGALRLVSAAWLAEGQPKEARAMADRAVGVAPKDPAVLMAAARAALATGDAAAARKLGERALKSGAKGAERDEAKRLAGGHVPRKR
jgi:tetratricopeptide (TPR) repeat protein